MSRLYDKVLARGKRADVGGRLTAPIPRRSLEDATVIWAENAASFFYETADKTWELAKDFPTLAPPLKNFFVEHKAPASEQGPMTMKLGEWQVPLWDQRLRNSPGVLGQGPDNSPAGLGDEWGFLFSSIDLYKEKSPEEPGGEAGGELVINPSSTLANIRHKAAEAHPDFPRQLRWVVDVASFHSGAGQSPVGPLFWWRLMLDGSGNLLDFGETEGCLPTPEGYEPGPAIKAAYAGQSATFFDDYALTAVLSGMLLPSLFTISLMNCKNVAVEEQSPPRKLSKKFERKHGRQLSRYHLLLIDAEKAELARRGGASGNGLSSALHICRGHFKSYTETNPLFGKHTGTYWWPQHTRGSTSAGKVEKDYRVEPPSLPRQDDPPQPGVGDKEGEPTDHEGGGEGGER